MLFGNFSIFRPEVGSSSAYKDKNALHKSIYGHYIYFLAAKKSGTNNRAEG